MAIKTKEETSQVAYKLPRRIIRLVRREAAEKGTYPAWVVAERLSESFDRNPPKQATGPAA